MRDSPVYRPGRPTCKTEVETLSLEATADAARRGVDNGKIVTAAGVSAGIDDSLHVVGRLLGEQAARDTARYMEYRWEPEAAAKPGKR